MDNSDSSDDSGSIEEIARAFEVLGKAYDTIEFYEREAGGQDERLSCDYDLHHAAAIIKQAIKYASPNFEGRAMDYVYALQNAVTNDINSLSLPPTEIKIFILDMIKNIGLELALNGVGVNARVAVPPGLSRKQRDDFFYDFFPHALNSFVKMAVGKTEVIKGNQALQENVNIHVNRMNTGWQLALRPKSAGDEESDLILSVPELPDNVEDARIELAGYISIRFVRWFNSQKYVRGAKIMHAKRTKAERSAAAKRAVSARIDKYGQNRVK
jgi:hypothetical protein